MTRIFVCALMMFFGLGDFDLHALEIIGHRGASQDAPENTLASFKLGWEQNADACELDIYPSKDGQIVVIHDADTKRTAGVPKKVADQTLDELRALDAGSWKGSQWKGEKIPTLAEALATIPDGKRMFIEFKCGPEVLPELERVLKASGKKPEQLVLIGFSYDTMKRAKQRIPTSPVYWLVSPKKESQGKSPTVEELIEKAKAAGLDGLFLQHTFAIDAAFIAKVKAAGLRFFSWNINDPAIVRKLAEAGVEGIGTDRPGWMRQQLK